MRIDKDSKIAGLPAMTVRDILRFCGDDFYFERFVLAIKKRLFKSEWEKEKWGKLTERETATLNKRADKIARDALNKLTEMGYFQKVQHDKNRWERTVSGNALASARAKKPTKKIIADKILADFLTRVREVNNNDYFLYKVVKVVLFGSMLDASTTEVGDIDIAIVLERREPDLNKFFELHHQRIKEAFTKGRTFQNIVDELSWPQREVRNYLKSRSRLISLHDFNFEKKTIRNFKILYNN